jgi:uncharacterized membrane protein HdeD (DUF308 family)
MSTYLLVASHEIRSKWGWYLLLGVVLLCLGVLALAHTVSASIISIIFLGWIVIFSGLAQAILAFRGRDWSGFSLNLLGGILEIVVGLLIVSAPANSALGVTLLLAVYLLVGSLFRIVCALLLGLPAAEWTVLGGVVTFLMGLALWRQWPLSGLVFLGVCVGAAMALHGGSWIAFALRLRKLPDPVGR